MPKAYPQEFREDVIRVARNREPGTRVKDIAKDYGVHRDPTQVITKTTA